jgi:hypothetical protein
MDGRSASKAQFDEVRRVTGQSVEVSNLDVHAADRWQDRGRRGGVYEFDAGVFDQLTGRCGSAKVSKKIDLTEMALHYSRVSAQLVELSHSARRFDQRSQPNVCRCAQRNLVDPCPGFTFCENETVDVIEHRSECIEVCDSHISRVDAYPERRPD